MEIILIAGAVALIYLALKKKKDKKKRRQSSVQTPVSQPAEVPLPTKEPTIGKTGLIIDSDIGRMGERSDKNDQRGFLMALGHFNKYHIEGLIGTSTFGANGAAAFNEIINRDYAALYDAGAKDKGFPSPQHLLRQSTNDYKHIIQAAKKYRPGNKLVYLVWGACTNLKKAIEKDRSIIPNLQVFAIGSTNSKFDPQSRSWIEKNAKQLNIVWDDWYFRKFVQPTKHGGKNATPAGCQAFRNKKIYTTPVIGDAFKRYPLDHPTGGQNNEWGNDMQRYKDGDLSSMYTFEHWNSIKQHYKKVSGTKQWINKSTKLDSYAEKVLGSRRDHVFNWLAGGLAKFRGLNATTNAPSNDPAPALHEEPRREKPSGHIPFNIGKVKWLHANVSSWKQTSTLSSGSISEYSTKLNHNKKGVWKLHQLSGGAVVNASAWIIVEVSGKWYAATWEYLRPNQTQKGHGYKDMLHKTKRDPLQNFKLQKGDKVGLMVSGLARTTQRTVKERSNILWVTL